MNTTSVPNLASIDWYVINALNESFRPFSCHYYNVNIRCCDKADMSEYLPLLNIDRENW